MKASDKRVLTYFYDEIRKTVDQNARGHMLRLENEFELIKGGLTSEDRYKYWQERYEEAFTRARGEFNLPLEKLNIDKFFNGYEDENILRRAHEIYNLLEDDRKYFIQNQSNHYTKVKIVELLTSKKKEVLEENMHEGSGNKPESPFKWKGTQIDLIHLFYGLVETSDLDYGSKKLKALQIFMKFFGINSDSEKLKSNHSKNVHDNNADYEPPIFDRAKNAYSEYRGEQIEKKKKK